MTTVVRPRSTSWGAVLSGWLAALGALTIAFPIAAAGLLMSPAAQARVDDPTLALPLVLALFVAWLSGGWVAGRVAGYRRSWHGLMSAVWGIFVGLVVALVAGGNAANFANAGASLPQLDVESFSNATVFGFILGIIAVIVGGWLGGLLAPPPLVMRTAPERERVVERRAPMPERRPLGDRAAAMQRRVDRREAPREGAGELTVWDRLTGRDREVAAPRDEALVPPAVETKAAGDGVPRRDETEVGR